MSQSSQILAQLMTSEAHDCFTTSDRNKKSLEDFYTIYKGSQMYTDTEFTHD